MCSCVLLLFIPITEYEEAQARRIVSEDAGHYILIKGLTKQYQNEQAVDILR